MTLQELWDELERHDWYFAMSDDHSVYCAGAANYSRLNEEGRHSRPHANLMKAFQDHKFSGKPWGTEQTPKPERTEQ